MQDRFGEAQGGRVEDFRLISGKGCFSADLRLPGQLTGVFVRSPHAHARIVSLDSIEARKAPGVVDILTSDDMDAAGIGSLSLPPPMTGRDGRMLAAPRRPALAGERVLHVGDAVALVVAETPQAALDAAELVEIEYEELPSVTDTETAVETDAPQLWPEAPGNIAIDWAGPVPDAANEAEVERIFAGSAHRVRLRLVNQRIAGVPMEPRGATARFDPQSGRYTLHVGSQGAGPLRAQLAATMGVEPSTIRILSDDVGGGFGLKAPVYPEYPALLAAARKLGRPIHWMATRSESFLTDNQGRDNVSTAELALDADGRFLALRVQAITNIGAYISPLSVHIATNNFGRCFPTVYDIPKVDVGVRCVFTNTVPTGPYRGAGRPEANYIMERLVEAAARQTGIDAVALRRMNLVPTEAMPHATAVGNAIDGGEFEAILDRALSLSGHASFAERRQAAAADGQAARHRPLAVPRTCRRHAARRRRHLLRGGRGRARPRPAFDRAGPRHALPRHARRAIVGPAGSRDGAARGFRHRPSRRTGCRIALHDDGEQRRGDRCRAPPREGTAAGGSRAGGSGGRYRLCRRRLRDRRHGPPDRPVRACREGRRDEGARRDRGRSRHARRGRDRAELSQWLPCRRSGYRPGYRVISASSIMSRSTIAARS